MNSRLLLQLLLPRRRARDEGFSILVGMLVVLAVTLGTLAMVSFSSGTLLGARKQGDRTDAQATADAGVDRVMAAFNSVENRKILVSGEAMGKWSSADLVSPCRDSSNKSPGNPTTEAKNYGDGKFRDLETLAVGSGTRQFRVVGITHSAGLADAADRRSQSITTTADSSTVSKVGNFSSDLINLNPPTDSKSSNLPGFNKGYFTITVEAKVVKGSSISTATVTREYEVLPKCCGASFGSNGSGGVTVSSSNSNSLGGDSRFCGVEFGLIVGLNGGTAWQNLANDYYTKRLNSTTVVPIGNVLGIVSKDDDKFDRKSNRVRPNEFSTVVPDPCDPARWNGGTCTSTGDNFGTGLKNAIPSAPFINYGTAEDIAGRALGNVPIIPSALTLPTIGNELTSGKYNITWTTNQGPWARVNSTSVGPNLYPVLNPAGASDYKFRFRTRTAAVSGFTTPPVVEVCNESATTLGGSNSCAAAGNWSAVNRNLVPVNSTETFSTITPNTWTNSPALTPSGVWVGSGWFEIDDNKASTASNAGRVRLVTSTAITGQTQNLQIGVGGSMTKEQNGLCRAINLSGNLGRGMLTFVQTGSSVSATDELWVQVQTAAGTACTGTTGTNTSTNWVTVAKFPGTTTQTRRVVSLADYQSATTRIRIINGTATSSTRQHIIGNIVASLSDWCQYSASSPASSAPGFHCLGPQFNMSVDTRLWTSSPAGGQIYMDVSGGPLSFYYTRTDDQRGNSYSYVNPTNSANPLIAVSNGGFLRIVKCGTTPNTACTTTVSETDVALVGDPDNFNIFGRDLGTQQVIYFGVLNTSTGTGRISGAWFYMPVGYFELKAYSCSGYLPDTGPDVSQDDAWILNGRIWTQHFKPCGDVHIRVPPSSGSNLGVVAAASNLFSNSVSYVPWTGTDWVARTITRSRYY